MDRQLPNLQRELISICESTNLGFNSTSELKEQIETLAERIETLNPTNEPTNQMELVQGHWQLLYSTFGLEREATLERLSFGKLPNVSVTVTNIFQDIYTNGQQYTNIVEFTLDSGIKGQVVVAGRYTVEGSQRLNIDFLETYVENTSMNLTESAFIEALGVHDKSTLKSTLSFNGWSDITYLDEDLRLMRGNNQNLYVLKKVGKDN
jgi:PAP_fibrillin